MAAIESAINASQQEVDEILKQNVSARDLSVMVGTLRRELNNNETRKIELRKQMQMIKNDFRAKEEERQQLQDRLNAYESENHTLKSRLRRLEKDEKDDVGSSEMESPEPAKRPRLAMKHLNEQNTPSPLTHVSCDYWAGFSLLCCKSILEIFGVFSRKVSTRC